MVAQVVEDYRGQDTIVLDMTNLTPVFDFFVITTGASRRQMRAMAEESDRVLEQSGSSRFGREGFESDAWVLEDYGNVVLHIFNPESREVYSLESLWADAIKIDWKNPQTESAEVEK
jgi:ribosome-associated protein